ncbi:putative membrane protein [Thiovulum sp. ES]|nr:putative membrane protein [Thiovulum sp. ES]
MENVSMSFSVNSANDGSRAEKETLFQKTAIESEKILEWRKGFGKFTLFLISLTLLVLISIIADSVIFAGELFEASALFGYFYVAIISLVLYLVGSFVYSEIVNYLSLKNIDSIRAESSNIHNIDKFKSEILGIYGISNFSTVGLSKMEVVQKIDDEVLSPLDREAEKVIFKYAKENALATAISPIALFDFMFILWRDVRMLNEISSIYGVKAGFVGNLFIMRRVLEQLIFIGVAEFTEEAISGIAGHSIFSKFSASAGEGIGHGILTLRVGFATVQSVRPIENRTSRKGFVGRFIKSLSPFSKKDS